MAQKDGIRGAQGIGFGLCLGVCFASGIEAAYAQEAIAPDQSLQVPSTVTPTSDSNIFFIDGGTVSGTNLFHSFESFSIPKDTTIIFRPDTNVTEVLSRVTGNQASEINGRLQVNGNANFFLMNPNGVIFGANSSLDVGGSMVATTAERFLFDDGSSFAATRADAPPLLSISQPSGLRFGSNPGTIINRSQSVDTEGEVRGLHVQPGKTLALIGGAVELEGGHIVSPQSSIDLGSVGNESLVQLGFSESQIIPGYRKVKEFGDINLSQVALIDSSGLSDGGINLRSGGAITLQGQNISVINGSRILSDTFGNGVGKDIVINASKTFEIVGVFQGALSPGALIFGALTAKESIVAAQLFGTGQGGNLFVQAQNVSVRDGAALSTSLFGSGDGGNLTLDVSQSIEIVGKTNLLGVTPELIEFAESVELDPNFLGEITTASSIAVSNFSTGQSGDLNIKSNRLSLRDGGLLNATPVDTGPGGNININVTEFLDLLGTADNESYSTSITASPIPDPTKSQGQPGNLNIKTGRLRILNGARIGVDTARTSGGLVTIQVSDSIKISGQSPSGASRSAISARSTVEGSGGRIEIETDRLTLSDYGLILASGSNTFNEGSPSFFDAENQPKGGDIRVLANSLSLDNFAAISTAAESDLGGNIDLKVRDTLLLQQNSNISAQAGAGGDGGNISIEANFIVAVPSENSDITASAFAGRGGNILATAQGILGFETGRRVTPMSDISAGSQLGIDGNVTIESPNVEPAPVEIELSDTIDAPQLAKSCLAAQASNNSFIRSGKGGIPATPTTPGSVNRLWQDLDLLPAGSGADLTEVAVRQRATPAAVQLPTQTEYQEAIAWNITSSGQVQLVAPEDATLSQLPGAVSCSVEPIQRA